MTVLEGPALDTDLDASQTFKINIFLPIMDSLIMEWNKRSDAYKEVNNRFSFLLKLRDLTNEQIVEFSENLASFYSQDLDQQEPISESQHLKHYLSVVTRDGKPMSSMSEIYLMIKDDKLESTFPNIEITVRMFLSMMVANCTGKSSLSKFTLIKNELRSQMLQERLNFLSVMSIESDVLENIFCNETLS